MRRVALLGLLAASVAVPAMMPAAAAGARDEGRCLPKALFPKGEAERPGFRLGVSDGRPTLCAPNAGERAGHAGCWTLDAGTGALSASAATGLPGRSERAGLGADGCVAGYCPSPRPEAGQTLLIARSTDGTRVAILADRTLHVFDAATRARSAVIPLDATDAPAGTNVSNAPVAMLYLGRTLYVVGSDAGPYIGVWAYGDDGRRLGVIRDPGKAGEEEASYSVYNGAASLLDDRHVVFAEAALQSLLILDGAGGPPQRLERPLTAAPCTAGQRVDIGIGDLDRLPKACRAFAAKTFEPYFDVDLIRLPSGDLLAALSGRYRGTLALLDGRTLAEKRRLRLARCGG